MKPKKMGIDETKNIFDELFEYSKIIDDKRLYNFLNKDRINAIILTHENIFWIEANSEIPNSIYNIIEKWGIIQGYKYLY